jgi:hypothetical protein
VIPVAFDLLDVGFCEVSTRRAVKPSGLNQSRELPLPEGGPSMQSLHPQPCTIQEYLQELSDPSRYRPDHCPLCHGPDPLRAHGFYCRSLVDVNYDGAIPVRRYLCLLCKRTVSLLPEFALPYLRFSIQVIGLFLVSRLLDRRTLRAAAAAAFQPNMPYQRGQFWVRRFQQQTAALCVALVSLTTVVPATDFLTRALHHSYSTLPGPRSGQDRTLAAGS